MALQRRSRQGRCLSAWTVADSRSRVWLRSWGGGPYFNVNEKGHVGRPSHVGRMARQLNLHDLVAQLRESGAWTAVAGALPGYLPGRVRQFGTGALTQILPAGIHQRLYLRCIRSR